MKSPSQETPRTQRTAGSAGKTPRTSTHARTTQRTPDSLITSPLPPQGTSALTTGEHAIQKSVPRLLAVDEFPTRSQTTEASPPSAESKLETYCKLCCKTTPPVHSVVGPKCHHCQLFEKQCWNLASGNYGGQSSRTQCDTCWGCNPDECRQQFQCMGIITHLPNQ